MFNREPYPGLGLFPTLEISRLLIVTLALISSAAWSINPFAKTESRTVEAFNQIVVGGLVNVEIKQGDKVSVEISAFGIELKDIISKVQDGTLIVTSSGHHSGESIAVSVTYQHLTAVKTSGSATIKTDGAINAESFRVDITDNGDAALELNVDELNIEMRDNGNLTLRGRTNAQKITSYGGGGRLDNSKLQLGME